VDEKGSLPNRLMDRMSNAKSNNSLLDANKVDD
jgi:hypothetical protein